MSTEPSGVALLARPGTAQDRLRAVIAESGADCVLDADPTALSPADLVAAAPALVLVALDSPVEDVLERFDEVLFAPGVDVVYEEAELAAGREGWEVARWQRHLVAKLQRHGNVLPPGHEPEDGLPAASPFDPVLAEEDVDFRFPAEPAGLPVLEWSVDPGPQDVAVAPQAPGAIGGGRGDPEPGMEQGPVLEEDGSVPAAGNADLEEAKARGRFERDLELLESRIAGLELVHDVAPVPGLAGAVVVLAGIGGPDAVRQLLGALPQGLPRPVLVRQQLDGARYDKLVAQMQRVSTLPVVLAVDGAELAAGLVHIVPPELGLEPAPDGHRFKAGAGLLGVLPAADSAVVLLSGSDPGLVEELMKERLAGALVLGQVAEGCYDPAAAQALVSRGGETDTPVKLAARIAAHWPPEGDTA